MGEDRLLGELDNGNSLNHIMEDVNQTTREALVFSEAVILRGGGCELIRACIPHHFGDFGLIHE